jgi:Plasmid pRiA4b ORF-3-like protein
VTTEKLRIALAKSFSSLGVLVEVGDREKPRAENGRRQVFLIYYDFGDLWKHQIRFEGIQAIREKKIYPVCVGGACPSPPEDCGGPKIYTEQIDHHRWNPPLDELQLIADAGGRVLDSQGHERIRDVLGDVDALEEAVDRLDTYERFRPGRH